MERRLDLERGLVAPVNPPDVNPPRGKTYHTLERVVTLAFTARL